MMIKRMINRFKKRRKTGHWVMKEVEIPCPEGNRGCIVIHYGKRMVWEGYKSQYKGCK
jgi:hypothetical protein